MNLSDNEKIDELIEKAGRNKSRQSFNIYQSIYEQSKLINYSKGIAYSAIGIANYYDKNDSPDKVIEYCSIARPIFSVMNDTSGEARCCNLIAKSFSTLGDFPRQAEYLFKGLELSIASRDLNLQHKFYNNISNYYMNYLKDYEKCMEYMQASLDIAVLLNDFSALVTCYLNIGLTNCYLKEYDKALDYLRQAEETNEKYVNDEMLRCYCVLYLGYAYFEQKKNELALKCYLECIEISKNNFYTLLYAESALLAGQTYVEMRRYEKAINILSEGITLCSENNFVRNLVNLYGLFKETYEKIGDYEGALNYSELRRKTSIQHLSVINEKNLERIKLLNHLQELQKESEILRQKNLELAKINELLIETDNEKNDFLGVVAHDLKNPLTNIILISSKLKKNAAKITSEKKINSLEKICLSSERMLDIIENLLDINKIESGDVVLNPAEIFLDKLLKEIISEFDTFAQQKNIQIKLNYDLSGKYFKADEMVVKEILINLISNALKYSHKDSEVLINVFAGYEQKINIEICDNGLGIKDEEKPKVFQKFAKISNKPTAGENSTGLGLSIVKKLTELSGGNIMFDSVYGKGSKFTLMF
ncbi:MAG: tetratricopeptide repeat-containing sensor histidine kinase [Ignavibacteria bacterium]|nr:tetratricopeptide repeat-containing sensor histidine kinase [Ignavibacteria bacterium]